jgi:ABC-type antimicrobial peptide transport system permease subunit
MSLLVSFVGIMNSMLMSVTERFREIGTMKCLGAPDDFVVSLFFVEATLTGIIASAVGWLLGFTMSVVQKLMGGGSIHMSPQTVLLLALGCTIGGGLMTLIATILPANQAAKMPAAAALRTEI